MGEEEDLDEWNELTAEQEKYLIQVRGPHGIFQYIIRDLAKVTNISNAAVLYDDEFVMTHHNFNLLINIRKIFEKLDTTDKTSLTAQIKRMGGGFKMKNFFILGSSKNIKMVLEVASDLKMYGEKFTWFA